MSGIDADRLARDDAVAAEVFDLLGRHGVLVFRDLHLEPEAQVQFCAKLGEIDYDAADDPIPGVMRVTLDRSKTRNAMYLKGTFFWHIDGCTPAGDECPQMATVLSAKAVAETGGETEFASTYAAYDDLTSEEKERFAVAARRPLARGIAATGVPGPEREARRRVADAQELGAPPRLDPSRRPPQPRARRVHRPRRRHGRRRGPGAARRPARAVDVARTASTATQWSVGDTVIWDNRGVVHRAAAYDADSPREMFRTTVLGDEPIE